ncbi:hypothetical protein B0O99DRAFT_615878 [Bisporella sp. PMI_857]|jgi:hypothetical protein|nr:hypothetical protein B0O99DRAFT_615878 [Bisporella sp. PMI_857]
MYNPQLYGNIDLSSRNLERRPDFEGEVCIEAWANLDDTYRPKNFVSRQRTFLQTITKRHDLATHIRSFT